MAGKKETWPAERVEEFNRLAEQGLARGDIAERLGVTFRSVKRQIERRNRAIRAALGPVAEAPIRRCQGCGVTLERRKDERPNRYAKRATCGGKACIARVVGAASTRRARTNRCRMCGMMIGGVGRQYCNAEHERLHREMLGRVYGRIVGGAPQPDEERPRGAQTIEEWLARGGRITRFEIEPLPSQGAPVRERASLFSHGRVR